MTDHVRPVEQSRGRNWCFTYNNPACVLVCPDPGTDKQDGKSDEWELIRIFGQLLFDTASLRYLIFQLERGDSGTPHFQGYMEYSSPMRFNHVRRDLPDGTHIEPRRGTSDQARDYCRKPDGLVGPWEYGEFRSQQGRRSDLDAPIKRIQEGATRRDIAEEFPHQFIRFHRGFDALRSHQRAVEREPCTVSLHYGPPGSGKSRRVYDSCPLDDLWVSPVSDKLWFDGYDSHPDALFDDFDGRMSHTTLTTVLRCTDRYPLRAQVKNSFIQFRPVRVFFTTNYHPRVWYDFHRRGAQYRALERRFSELCLWSLDGRFLRIAAGDVLPGQYSQVPLWRRFWDFRPPPTPPHAQEVPQLNRNDLYALVPAFEEEEDLELYCDFMFE